MCFASDGILYAVTLIGEIIVFELDQFVESLLKKEEVLNSHENLQFWQITQPLLLNLNKTASEWHPNLNDWHPRI